MGFRKFIFQIFHIPGTYVAQLNMFIEIFCPADSTDARVVFPREGKAQKRSLTFWSLGVHRTGQQVNSRFVYEQDCIAFFFGIFLDFRPTLL